MSRRVRIVRVVMLASVLAAAPAAAFGRQLPSVAFACLLAWAAAMVLPKWLTQAGYPLSARGELAFLVPFVACWSLGEGLGLFHHVSFYDDVAHAVGGAAAAAVVLDLFDDRLRTGPGGTLFIVFFFALGMGALWEAGEFVSDTLLGTGTQTGLRETMLDLLSDAAGAAAFCAVHAVRMRKHRYEEQEPRQLRLIVGEAGRRGSGG